MLAKTEVDRHDLAQPVEVEEAYRQSKWVVVHDSARDHYEIPLALAEEDLLERFVTDWYTPLDHVFWARASQSRFCRSTLGIHSRHRAELPTSRISDRKLGFLAGLVWRKLTHSPYRDEIEGQRAARLAASIANRRNAPLLATSYSGAEAFARLRKDLPRALFQVHPHPRSLRSLYQKLIAQDPDYVGLQNEPEASVSDAALATWETESAKADMLLCASEFTKKSLLEGGASADRIHVVPYGVDSDLFQFGRPRRDTPFTAVFVGQKVARKGLRTLVRAWKQARLTGARLVLAGGHVRDVGLLDGFEGVYEEVPRTSLQALIRLYQEADLFVLPSVAEGFGHVYLEALACGTPILCTENTGGADIIREFECGWMVPPANREALADRLAWCADHRAALREMRDNARAAAKKWTWSRFREHLRQCLFTFEQMPVFAQRQAGLRDRKSKSAEASPTSVMESITGER